MSTDLRHAARDYVAVRRALGYQLRGYDRFLDDLVSDLERAEAVTLTIELAVAWATKAADVPPFRWKVRLGIARGFARYLETLDPATQVPPTNLLASAARGQLPTSTPRAKSRRCCRRPSRSRRCCGRRPTARCWGCWR